MYKHCISQMQRSDGTPSCIPDLGTRCKWAVTFTFELVYSWGKRPPLTISQKGGLAQSQPGHGGDRKNSCPIW